MTRFLLAVAMTATMCTPAGTKQPAEVLPPPTSDAGPSNLCPKARQALVDLGCPPAETYFGEWEAICAAKANGQTIADCIIHKSVCVEAHNCEDK